MTLAGVKADAERRFPSSDVARTTYVVAVVSRWVADRNVVWDAARREFVPDAPGDMLDIYLRLQSEYGMPKISAL